MVTGGKKNSFFKGRDISGDFTSHDGLILSGLNQCNSVSVKRSNYTFTP